MRKQEFDFTYRVKRSARHSVAVQVTAGGEVIVRAPYLTPDWAIRQFVLSKRSWIEKNLAQVRNYQADQPEPFTEEELARLKKAAKADLLPRVRHYAAIMGLSYGQVSIRAQKTRWGSCSRKGNLNFNCLLELLPEEIRDYVVVHELAHLIEMNHSPRFWAEVEKVLPDYKARRTALRKLGRPLISRIR